MGACLLGCLPPLPLACFLAPIPLTPFPSGEGGIFSFLMQGASPLASPGLGGMRHWGCLRKAGYGGGLAVFVACRLRLAGARWGLAFLVACRPCPEPSLSFIPISRQEDRAQTIGLSQYSIFGKSSGGSGGLFQESPSVLPSVLPVVSPAPSANAVRRERVRERPSRCMTV